ncbi:unnamed protein product [Macrosiphum euphorbiae]|uniref:Uncharacterized protein n=1 Tax=Macrosiphum euphorbiae TaxID=13131 RepID=A0AAV0YC53_9HEMI|nr:unnamed protein product [Macrosiphum euphorbiae]
MASGASDRRQNTIAANADPRLFTGPYTGRSPGRRVKKYFDGGPAAKTAGTRRGDTRGRSPGRPAVRRTNRDRRACGRVPGRTTTTGAETATAPVDRSNRGIFRDLSLSIVFDIASEG